MADLPRAPYDPEFDPLLALKQLQTPDAEDGRRAPSRTLKTTNSHHLRTWEALVHHICATLGRDYIRKDLASIDSPVSLATLVSHLGIQRTSSRATLVFLSTVASLQHLDFLLRSLQRDMAPCPEQPPVAWAAEDESRVPVLERQLRDRQQAQLSPVARYASRQTSPPHESTRHVRSECDGCVDTSPGCCLLAGCGMELAEADRRGWSIVWGLLFSVFECSESNDIVQLCKALQRMCNKMAVVNRYVSQQGSCRHCGAMLDTDLRAQVISGLAVLLVDLVAAGRGTPVASLFERRLASFEQELETAASRASTLLTADITQGPPPMDCFPSCRVCPGCGSSEPENCQAREEVGRPSRSGTSTPRDEPISQTDDVSGNFVVID